MPFAVFARKRLLILDDKIHRRRKTIAVIISLIGPAMFFGFLLPDSFYRFGWPSLDSGWRPVWQDWLFGVPGYAFLQLAALGVLFRVFKWKWWAKLLVAVPVIVLTGIFTAVLYLLTVYAHGATNKYYNDAKALAEKVSSQGDQQAWDKLMKGASSGDKWLTSYSLGFLQTLVEKNRDIDRKSLIEKFAAAVDDPNEFIQADGLRGLASTGQSGVMRGFDKIKAFALSHDDNTRSWLAIDALALVTEPPQVHEAVAVLAQALLVKTPGENIHDAPRLRDMALESLRKIARKNSAWVKAELMEILPKLDEIYADKVSTLIAGLKESQSVY